MSSKFGAFTFPSDGEYDTILKRLRLDGWLSLRWNGMDIVCLCDRINDGFVSFRLRQITDRRLRSPSGCRRQRPHRAKVWCD